MPYYDPRNIASGFRLNSNYGERPGGGNGDFHRGQDWGATAGTPVPVAADGTVVSRGFSQTLGYFAIIEHTDAVNGQFYTGYSHLQSSALSAPGTEVQGGDIIGLVGATGTAANGDRYGSHLHFGVYTGDATVNMGDNRSSTGFLERDFAIDPRTINFAGPGGWVTTVIPAVDRPPGMMRLGGPEDLATVANDAGSATTVEYADGTTSPGVVNGQTTVQFDDGTTGNITLHHSSPDGSMAWGSLAVQDAAGNQLYTDTVEVDGVTQTTFDPLDTQPWDTHTLATDADGTVTANVYDYGTAADWQAVHALQNGDVAAMDEASANALMATTERDAFQNDALGAGSPTPFEWIDVAHRFDEGAYDIDPGALDTDPGTPDTTINLEDSAPTDGFDLTGCGGAGTRTTGRPSSASMRSMICASRGGGLAAAMIVAQLQRMRTDLAKYAAV